MRRTLLLYIKIYPWHLEDFDSWWLVNNSELVAGLRSSIKQSSASVIVRISTRNCPSSQAFKWWTVRGVLMSRQLTSDFSLAFVTKRPKEILSRQARSSLLKWLFYHCTRFRYVWIPPQIFFFLHREERSHLPIIYNKKKYLKGCFRADHMSVWPGIWSIVITLCKSGLTR